MAAVALSGCGGGANTSGGEVGGNYVGEGNANGGQNPQAERAESGVGRDVATDPSAFVGKRVTVAGIVGQVFTPNAFTITSPGDAGKADGDRKGGGNFGVGGSGPSGTSPGGSGGNNAGRGLNPGTEPRSQTLLVLSKAPISLAPGAGVRVSGVVAPNFTAQTAQRFTGSAPNSPALASYTGQPFVQADSAGR